MQLFLETDSLDEIRQARELGVIDGVVTTPLAAQREKKPYPKVLAEMAELAGGPVFADVTSHLLRDMIAEAKTLAAISDDIILKLPANKPGQKALRHLARHDIHINMTLCFNAAQAIAAAKANAAYISPYIGERDEKPTKTRLKLIAKIRRIFANYEYPTRILASPVRTSNELVEVALLGADAAAVPLSVFDQMLTNPLTEAKLKQLLSRWKPPKF
ncbi:MAG: fructose-6-phosphate aldolase [Phycisphaerales bacterium]|jgi:transaldolase|nr:fructose-6-phosphate aldolase [Phycisphaerales bacterium]